MSSTNSNLSLLTFICFILCTSFVLGARFKLQSRIVGGQDAVRGQFPYSVSIRDYTSKSIHCCGGAIISDRHILTAAHCLQEKRSKAENLFVVVGALLREKDGTVMNVTNISIHRDFDNETYKNDIAIITTADQITFTDTVKPIALTKTAIPMGDALSVVVNGFGRRWVSFPICISISYAYVVEKKLVVHRLSMFSCTQIEQGKYRHFELTNRY